MKSLREFRQKAKLTQNGIANVAKISTMTYQRYEAGKRVPDVYTAQRIAKVLGTTVEELFPLPTS